MAQNYRVEIDQPATKTRVAKSWAWTADSGIIESIEVELQKEGKRITVATVSLWDKKENGQWWPITNQLPDPAFADVPIRIYLSRADSPSSFVLIFDGKVTSLQPGFPGPSNLVIVAHDRSIDMRMKARYRTYAKLTSVQIAQKIAADYGLTVDLSELVGVTLSPRALELGAPGVGRGLSDHAQMVRALAADGLELYVKGKKIKIRQLAQAKYSRTFRPDDGYVIEFRPTINHVSSPSGGGQSKTPTPGGSKGTVATAHGDEAKENQAAGTEESTHRTIPQGAKSAHTGAHTESLGSNEGKAYQNRKRKDEASLTVRGLPDIGLQHIVSLNGWGAKFDGDWHLTTAHHSIAGSGHLTTALSMTRSPSGGAQKQIGIQPSGTRVS